MIRDIFTYSFGGLVFVTAAITHTHTLQLECSEAHMTLLQTVGGMNLDPTDSLRSFSSVALHGLPSLLAQVSSWAAGPILGAERTLPATLLTGLTLKDLRAKFICDHPGSAALCCAAVFGTARCSRTRLMQALKSSSGKQPFRLVSFRFLDGHHGVGENQSCSEVCLQRSSRPLKCTGLAISSLV
eukprot:4815286-Amphidinium_carterae.1